MQKLNTTLVYILSILGFILCCCSGIGVIPAAIAFFLAGKELKKYAANPEMYSNGPAMKTAKTVALVALILSGLVAAYSLYQFATTTAEERAANQIELMRSFGVPDDVIDQIEDANDY